MVCDANATQCTVCHTPTIYCARDKLHLTLQTQTNLEEMKNVIMLNKVIPA